MGKDFHSELLSKVDEFGTASQERWREIKAENDALRERVELLETQRDIPRRSDDGARAPAFTLIDKEGKRYPALTKSQSFYEYVRALPGATEEGDFSLGEYVRGAMLGERKVASGAALVPTRIGAQIIDDVRAATALIRAGAATIPIEAPTNFARITADAVVYEHTEAATDITEGSPTFAAVVANPKTPASLIPLTLEVVADSPNLDAALRTSISAAMALKLDQLGIAVILADATIPDSSVAHDPATWSGTMLAVGAAMTANQTDTGRGGREQREPCCEAQHPRIDRRRMAGQAAPAREHARGSDYVHDGRCLAARRHPAWRRGRDAAGLDARNGSLRQADERPALLGRVHASRGDRASAEVAIHSAESSVTVKGRALTSSGARPGAIISSFLSPRRRPFEYEYYPR
jgi:Phage capsid family